tara:strand:+ start:20659 stop:21558 length:900 start_codon:yes stop_codon:yes gene_type:complete
MSIYKKTRKNSILCGLCLVAFLVFPTTSHATLDRAREAGFMAHKALYEIQLSSKSSSSKIANISGKMFYEWQPSCDAWVSNHRFDMMYEYSEGPALRVTSDFSTYESFDGARFNYTSQRKKDGAVFEEVRGNVKANEAAYPNEAVYTIPEDLVFDLPKGTLFPMAHTLDVLNAIRTNKKFVQATIFDGSDDEGPVEVNSFIGKPATYTIPEEYKEYIDKDLVQAKAWKLRLAFFPLNKPDSTSDYEMSLVFHENGVISDMEIDYGDFSVTQTLVAIEPLGDACDPEVGAPADIKKIKEK